ncbi:Adenosine receptor A1 [Bulinus truncatus]|nr:Adenosine receptor A1 [Bulinus truncatus]
MTGAERGFELRDGLYFTAEAVIGLMAVTFNSLVVATIVKTPALHSVTNVFICNLAAADVSVGLFVTPAAIMSFYGVPGNFYGCVIINCIQLIFTSISVIMLLVIALDRFFAIKEPFLYQKEMTLMKAYFINASVWVLGALIGLIPLYAWDNPYKEMEFCRFTEVISLDFMVYVYFFCVILTPMSVMFTVYIYIFFVVKKHSRLIISLNSRFASSSEINLAMKWYKRDVKAFKMIILVVAFGVCKVPIQILNSITLFCKSCTYPYALLLCTIVLDNSNSCLNPFLYAAGSSAIRAAIKQLVMPFLFREAEGTYPYLTSSSLVLERSLQREARSKSILSGCDIERKVRGTNAVLLIWRGQKN